MKKLTNQILMISSGFLIFTIGISYLFYNYIKSQNVVCETKPSLAYCGIITAELNERVQKGKQIFNINCAACHTLDKKMTGPSLRGILNTRGHPYKNYVYDFITKEDSLIGIKDTYTLVINEEYNINFNHNFKLNGNDFENLMEYLKE